MLTLKSRRFFCAAENAAAISAAALRLQEGRLYGQEQIERTVPANRNEFLALMASRNNFERRLQISRATAAMFNVLMRRKTCTTNATSI
jgi:hypothetical protein